MFDFCGKILEVIIGEVGEIVENLNKTVRQTLNKLNAKGHTYQSIYQVMFSFAEHVIAETTDGSKIIKTTYGQCQQEIVKAAPKLKKLLGNLETNSIVGLKLENSLNWIIAFWTILRIGYRPLLINCQNDELMISQTLKELNVKAIISDSGTYNVDNYINIQEFINDEISSDDEANWANEIVLTTSGTTAASKICIYDGEAICNEILKSEYVIKKNNWIKGRYHGHLKLLAFLPFYHIFGLVATLMWFGIFGRTFVFLKDSTPDTLLRTIKKHEVTHVFAVPIVWNMVAKAIHKEVDAGGEKLQKRFKKGVRLSTAIQKVFINKGPYIVGKTFFKQVKSKVFGPSVCFCISGGGYILDDSLKTLNAIGYPLYNGYGTTEIGITSVELRKSIRGRTSGSVGKPFVNIEYQVNEQKELLVRGDSLYSSRIINGQQVVRNPHAWYATGDIAYTDKKGNYYISGRLSDVIILENGENINPDDVERYFDLDNVIRFSILGLPNKNYEDIAIVIQVPKNTTARQLRILKNQIYECNQKVPLRMQVSKIMITNVPLGRDNAIKIKRAYLRKMIIENKISFMKYDINHLDTTDEQVISEEVRETITQIIKIMSKILQKDENLINPSDHFIFDLGGNSLEYFSLVSEIEEAFNIHIDYTDGNTYNSAYDFAQYIMKK